MFGVIAGDMIGSPYERKNIATRDFPLFQPASRYTDDTVLTIATAAALLDNPEATAEDFARNYIAYYKRFPKRGFGKGFREWATAGKLRVSDSYGNGCAMRVSPIAWAFDDFNTVQGFVERSVFYTHNHEESYRGAKAIAHSTWMARNGYSKDRIRKAIQNVFKYTLDETPEDLLAKYHFASCQASVPLAIRAFLESDDYEDCIRTAVVFGGDTDTIAAMAGGIAEAFYGRIPYEIQLLCMERMHGGLLQKTLEFRSKFMGKDADAEQLEYIELLAARPQYTQMSFANM